MHYTPAHLSLNAIELVTSCAAAQATAARGRRTNSDTTYPFHALIYSSAIFFIWRGRRIALGP